ncbi:hypothetical protein ACFSL6_17095 [Paenibacillus thailandensis]|uniref:Uncharacterized protein n=1 Tax=Paenibacillus thailandensis TaxID=393250 RepID=A0ABW5QYK6_9BACL
MNNVPAYYVPIDTVHMIYLYASDAADAVLNAFLTWAERPDSDRYVGAAVLLGSFTGQRNHFGGLDGAFRWRGRSYDVVDSLLMTFPPDDGSGGSEPKATGRG